MRSLILAAGTLIGLASAAFGQVQAGPFWSLGGHGNVVYPGTGHSPAATPPGAGAFVNSAINTGFPFVNPVNPAGGFVSGFGAGGGGFRGGKFGGHPQHGLNNVVLFPVYYGGYGYAPGYGNGCDPSTGCGQGYPDQPPVINSGSSSPPVIINQNYVPPQANPQVREYPPNDANADQSSSGLRMYQAPTPGQMTPAQQAQASGQATVYLIAFKDHSIVQALGYWMEGSTLHYVTVDHDLNQVSLNLIDRDLSQRLNSERNIEFRIPAAR